jgi:hypothetical protein
MAIGVALLLAAAGGAAATGAGRSSTPVQAIGQASTTDVGTASVSREVVRADELADRGYRGAGVTRALLDWSTPTWYASPEYPTPLIQTTGDANECDGHNWEGCWDGAQEPGNSEGHNWESSTWYGVEG